MLAAARARMAGGADFTIAALLTDTGVNRASILHYNTIEEIQEFGTVLRELVRSE